MTEKPNCGNCPHSTHVVSLDKEGCTKYNRTISWQQKCIIDDVGCLSHPNARVHLMAPVIAELERRENKCRLHESFDMADAYGKAIALVRDGVK
jgi:hypothetical protein